MQKRRNDRFIVELPGGADFRDRDRMGDVRLATLPILPEVGFIAEVERSLDLLDFFRRKIAAERRRQFRNGNDVMATRLFRRGKRPEHMASRLSEGCAT